MRFSEEDIESMTSYHVKIKLNDQSIPERHGEWFDLATAEDVYLKKGEHQKIPLGVAMEMPPGYYAMMAPRSSTFERWGIIQTNSIGIYEHDYCGDNDTWAFPAYATREVIIPKGTRICQFQIFPQHPPIKFIPVESMEKESRGGWGSTGR